MAKWKQQEYAESARWEQQQAYQRYRQGERAEPQPQNPWWQKAGDWLADRVDNAAGAIQSGWDALKVRHLKFTKLEDGHISVRAETPPGTRIEYRRTVAEVMNSNPDEFFGGTRYNPETVAARISGGLLRSSISKGSLALTLPSAQVDAWRNAVPAFSFVSPGHVISFGKVSSGMVATDANPGLAVNLDGYLIAATGIQPITTLTPRVDGFDLNVRNPVQKYEFLEGASKVRVSSSVTARVTWGGFWNTTVGVDVNMLEVQVHSGGMKGRAGHGVYVEWKPGRLVTYGTAILVLALTPWPDEIRAAIPILKSLVDAGIRLIPEIVR